MRDLENEGSGKCQADGCVEFRFDQDAALREGWDLIEGSLYCALHAPSVARQALITVELERLRARQAQENRKNAKVTLTPEEYRQWDKFQSGLADFHKKHGKLAPAMLRTMDAKTFIHNVKATGPIDVEEVADRLFEAEKAADKTRSWLLGR